MRRTVSISAWAVGILLSTTVLAQDILTIEEAVTGAYSTYAPQRVNDFEWIPGTDTYSYRKGEGREAVIMRGHTDDRADEVLFDLEKIRDAFLNAGFVQPEEVPPFIWLDSERVLFTFKGQYWEYNTQWKMVAKRISCSRVVQNRELSPEHRYVAGTVGDRVYLSDKNNDTIPLTDPTEGITQGQAVSRWEFGIDKGLFWSPDEQKLAFYEKDERPVSDYILMDYTTIPAQEAPVKYPMAGQGSEIVKLKVFDLKKNRIVELATEGEPDQYLTSVTWDLDGKSILVGHLDRSQNNFKMARYDASTGELDRILFEEKDDAYVEPEQAPYMLPDTKGEFLWFSERDGYNHIYHYDRKGELLGQVTRGEHVMQRILHYDAENKELIVLGTGSPIETVAYRVSLDGTSMTRITPEPGLHRVKVSDSGNYMVDAHSSLEIPRRTVIRDRNGKVLKTLLDAPDPLEGKKVGQTEIFSIQAEDGTDLYCRMIKPSDFDPSKKYPVFVYVYGGPHVQLIHDTWLGAASLWMHHLAEQGYIIFTLDGRGSSNRGSDFEQAVHRQLGLLEVKDQMAGVEYLRSQDFVDADRMAVHGWSYGGYMTLNLMLRQPGAFKVGVAGGAVTDWRFYEVMYTERYMDSPADNPSGYESTRLSSLADKLEGELLLIHNTSDDIVVPQHYMVMMNAFINADKQVDTFIYPGHKHNVRGPDRVHLIERIVDYVKEHL